MSVILDNYLEDVASDLEIVNYKLDKLFEDAVTELDTDSDLGEFSLLESFDGLDEDASIEIDMDKYEVYAESLSQTLKNIWKMIVRFVKMVFVSSGEKFTSSDAKKIIEVLTDVDGDELKGNKMKIAVQKGFYLIAGLGTSVDGIALKRAFDNGDIVNFVTTNISKVKPGNIPDSTTFRICVSTYAANEKTSMALTKETLKTLKDKGIKGIKAMGEKVQDQMEKSHDARIGRKARRTANKIEDHMKYVADVAGDLASDAVDAVKNSEAYSKASNAYNNARDKASNAVSSVKNKAKNIRDNPYETGKAVRTGARKTGAAIADTTSRAARNAAQAADSYSREFGRGWKDAAPAEESVLDILDACDIILEGEAADEPAGKTSLKDRIKNAGTYAKDNKKKIAIAGGVGLTTVTALAAGIMLLVKKSRAKAANKPNSAPPKNESADYYFMEDGESDVMDSPVVHDSLPKMDHIDLATIVYMNETSDNAKAKVRLYSGDKVEPIDITGREKVSQLRNDLVALAEEMQLEGDNLGAGVREYVMEFAQNIVTVFSGLATRKKKE